MKFFAILVLVLTFSKETLANPCPRERDSTGQEGRSVMEIAMNMKKIIEESVRDRDDVFFSFSEIIEGQIAMVLRMDGQFPPPLWEEMLRFVVGLREQGPCFFKFEITSDENESWFLLELDMDFYSRIRSGPE